MWRIREKPGRIAEDGVEITRDRAVGVSQRVTHAGGIETLAGGPRERKRDGRYALKHRAHEAGVPVVDEPGRLIPASVCFGQSQIHLERYSTRHLQKSRG